MEDRSDDEAVMAFLVDETLGICDDEYTTAVEDAKHAWLPTRQQEVGSTTSDELVGFCQSAAVKEQSEIDESRKTLAKEEGVAAARLPDAAEDT